MFGYSGSCLKVLGLGAVDLACRFRVWMRGILHRGSEFGRNGCCLVVLGLDAGVLAWSS